MLASLTLPCNKLVWNPSPQLTQHHAPLLPLLPSTHDHEYHQHEHHHPQHDAQHHVQQLIAVLRAVRVVEENVCWGLGGGGDGGEEGLPVIWVRAASPVLIRVVCVG